MCLTCKFFDKATTLGTLSSGNGILGDLKGFGNANHVFQVTWESPNESEMTNSLSLVARCSKRAHTDMSPLDEKMALLEEKMWAMQRGYHICQEDTVKDHIAYVSQILAPQLGLKYLPLMVNALDIKRSGGGDGHENSSIPAILMPDATVLIGVPLQSTVCLEIKPKFGSILRCDTIDNDTHRYLKHSRSRYSLHQTLKLRQGSIAAKSEYDPLDLFSGDARRMHASLVALLKHPQNNLTVFIGGERMPSKETTYMKICEAMVGVTPSDIVTSMDMLASLVSRILLQEDVLQKILAVQSKCSHDVQAVETMLDTLLSDAPLTTDDVDRYLSILAAYCESATAKDCSIMITMAPYDDTISHHATKCQASSRPCEHGYIKGCRYRITVVDLDRKSIGKIKHHATLDRQIMESNILYNDDNIS